MTARQCLIWVEGPAPAAVNTARDQATRNMQPVGPAYLRFHRHRPAASVGRHEAIGHALRIDYCTEAEIPIVRRVTGGGALYLDEDQLWATLTVPRPWLTDSHPAAVMEHLNRAVATGLRELLGIDVVPRAPDEIEVAGRKIGAGFLTVEDAVAIYHLMIFERVTVESQLKVLRAPREKLSREGVQSARQRFTTLTELTPVLPETSRLHTALADALCHALRLSPTWDREPGPLPISVPTPGPELVDHRLWGNDEDSWQAFLPVSGGALHLRLKPDSTASVIHAAEWAGTVHAAPPDIFVQLGDVLAGTPMDQAEAVLQRYLDDHNPALLGCSGSDLSHLLRLTLARRGEERLGLTRNQANTLMVHSDDGTLPAHEILERASVMLVPYCAKPAWCKWRHRDGCPECGLCEVGEAYRMARERGMRVTTITHFEHLQATFAEMAEDEVSAYVGMCCSRFYLKRAKAFRAAGIPAVLMDISGSNCYELRQEDLAYAGQFTAEAELDKEVTEKVVRWIPIHAPSGSHHAPSQTGRSDIKAATVTPNRNSS